MLGYIDYTILIVYTLFVLGIGFALKRYMKTSTDFFLSGRSIPAWIAALGVRLGQPRGARGDRHGSVRRQVRHDDLPLLLARGGGGDGVRGRVHDAVLLRLEGPVRARVSEAPFRRKDPRIERHLLRRDDDFPVGHVDVCPGEDDATAAGLGLQRQLVDLGGNRAGLPDARRADLGHLQRSAPVLPDRDGFPAAAFSSVCTKWAAGRA